MSTDGVKSIIIAITVLIALIFGGGFVGGYHCSQNKTCCLDLDTPYEIKPKSNLAVMCRNYEKEEFFNTLTEALGSYEQYAEKEPKEERFILTSDF